MTVMPATQRHLVTIRHSGNVVSSNSLASPLTPETVHAGVSARNAGHRQGRKGAVIMQMRTTCGPSFHLGRVQISPICTRQLTGAETMQAAPNGGTARLWVPGFGTRGEQLAKGR
jgi:hypothetical protein